MQIKQMNLYSIQSFLEKRHLANIKDSEDVGVL